jgi:hypothetical protein
LLQREAGSLLDLPVDRSADPLGDLRRLMDASSAYDSFNCAVDKLFGGDAAAPSLTSTQVRPGGGAAGPRRPRGLAGGAEALVAARPSWEVIVRSFAAKGLVTLPSALSVDNLLG